MEELGVRTTMSMVDRAADTSAMRSLAAAPRRAEASVHLAAMAEAATPREASDATPNDNAAR